MLGCSTVCPKCKHQFSACCSAPPACCPTRRSLLSGGGLISPSAPLSFVLPSAIQAPPPPEAQPEVELERLAATESALLLSGWYYGGCPHTRSDELLKHAAVGTFLVRDSSDPRFLYSLSVQTERGPKSVRLHYSHGHFRLDAQSHLQPSMPLFTSVLDLVQNYVKKKPEKHDAHVWVDHSGKWSALRLERPLRKEGQVPSLKHLARLAINKVLESPKSVQQLELPPSLTVYLAEYPYSI